jgi:hypothetical protein
MRLASSSTRAPRPVCGQLKNRESLLHADEVEYPADSRPHTGQPKPALSLGHASLDVGHSPRAAGIDEIRTGEVHDDKVGITINCRKAPFPESGCSRDIELALDGDDRAARRPMIDLDVEASHGVQVRGPVGGWEWVPSPNIARKATAGPRSETPSRRSRPTRRQRRRGRPYGTEERRIDLDL